MNLNQTHLGHFIDQLTTASKFFGFSEADASTLEVAMNARYNVRCSPATNGQLNSLCQAPECPLAAPSADCDAYKDLGPNGPGNSTQPSQSAASSSSAPPTSSPTTATTVPTSSATDSPTASPAAAGSSAGISSGAIAGIAIGGAAVFLLAAGLYLYWRRHSRKQDPPQIVPVPYGGGYNSPPSHMSYLGSNHHTSYAGQSPVVPHDSYMSGLGPGAWSGSPKPPDELGAGGYDDSRRASSPARVVQQEIAEMDSQPDGPGRESSPAFQGARMPSPLRSSSPATQHHDSIQPMGSEFSSPVYQGDQHGYYAGRQG